MPSRPFGAGFGTGTVCAAEGPAMPARLTAIAIAKAVGLPRE